MSITAVTWMQLCGHRPLNDCVLSRRLFYSRSFFHSYWTSVWIWQLYFLNLCGLSCARLHKIVFDLKQTKKKKIRIDSWFLLSGDCADDTQPHPTFFFFCYGSFQSWEICWVWCCKNWTVSFRFPIGNPAGEQPQPEPGLLSHITARCHTFKGIKTQLQLWLTGASFPSGPGRTREKKKLLKQKLNWVIWIPLLAGGDVVGGCRGV